MLSWSRGLELDGSVLSPLCPVSVMCAILCAQNCSILEGLQVHQGHALCCSGSVSNIILVSLYTCHYHFAKVQPWQITLTLHFTFLSANETFNKRHIP